MSENIQMPGNGLQVNAGPVTVAASGGLTINVLLTILIVASSAYVVWTVNQQTILLTQQHDVHQAQMAANAAMVVSLTRANENVFLSTMLPDARKKDLPNYIQDRAREIVESRAANITQERVPNNGGR